MQRAGPYGHCKRSISDSAAARLAISCKTKPNKIVLPKMCEAPEGRMEKLPACNSPHKSKYLLEQGESVYYEKHSEKGSGVRWLHNRRNGKFRRQELLHHSVEHRLLHKLGHRPTGKMHLSIANSPVSDAFTPATPFYPACDLPELTFHQMKVFTEGTSKFLDRVYAKRAAKGAACIGTSAWSLAESVLELLVSIKEAIVMAKLRNVQIELDKRVGMHDEAGGFHPPEITKNSCPDIRVDVLAKKISILNTIQFLGGKAQIEPDDLGVCMQLCKIVSFMYEIMGKDMIHVRVDGHVHDTGKPDKCLIISYFRAAEICRYLTKFVPKKFIHAFGYGGTKPISATDTSLNRRVEISLLISEERVLRCCTAGRKLWNKITPLAICEKLMSDPKFVGDPNFAIDIADFAPNDMNNDNKAEDEGQETPLLDDKRRDDTSLATSASAPVLK